MVDFLPVFESVDDERLYRKRRLAAAYRLFAKLGFEDGSVGAAGHITARDPGEPETFWVNPYGVPFAHLTASSLVRVDANGAIVEGAASMVNGAAFAIHSQIHAARPDVVAAAHSHSLHGKAFSTLGRPLRPLTQDACAFFDDHVVYDAFSGVVLDLDEGKRIATLLADKKAAILKNHGLLTVGGSVDAAVGAYVTMEHACRVQLLAEAAGAPDDIPEDVARSTNELVGSPLAMWFTFQPLYDQIVKEQPDLLA
jgi:ribulose-5-phosphate 4-epimerase/fuculose-1-phosphate aldolase